MHSLYINSKSQGTQFGRRKVLICEFGHRKVLICVGLYHLISEVKDFVYYGFLMPRSIFLICEIGHRKVVRCVRFYL